MHYRPLGKSYAQALAAVSIDSNGSQHLSKNSRLMRNAVAPSTHLTGYPYHNNSSTGQGLPPHAAIGANDELDVVLGPGRGGVRGGGNEIRGKHRADSERAVDEQADSAHFHSVTLIQLNCSRGGWRVQIVASFKVVSLLRMQRYCLWPRSVADMNGDGKPDIHSKLLPTGRENSRWIVWENLGGLKFREHVILDANLVGNELQVGDVDRDGDIDLCSKSWAPCAWNGPGGKMHVDFWDQQKP